MEIQSTRFGRLNVDDDRVMTFPNGLLGFPSYTRFALVRKELRRAARYYSA